MISCVPRSARVEGGFASRSVVSAEAIVVPEDELFVRLDRLVLHELHELFLVLCVVLPEGTQPEVVRAV